MNELAAFVYGLYVGGAMVTSLTVGTSTVDGLRPTWREKAFIFACWPYVMLSLADQE